MKESHQPVKRSMFTEIINCIKIAVEYFIGIVKFRNLMPCITIYGSARLDKNTKEYKLTFDLAKKLTESGYNIITGGGPGIMQAANEGAYSSKKGKSAGCSIYIPHETFSNPFLEFHHHCNYFFIRKVLLTRFSSGFIALPGGFGTLDELFEMLTLIKTHRISNFPIILVDKKFWEPMLDFIKDKMLTRGTVSEDEMECISITDDISEALAIIKKSHGK